MKKLMKYWNADPKDGIQRDIEHITRAELFYESRAALTFLDREAENDFLAEVRFSIESGKTPLFFCNEMGCNSRDAS
jgi:hypothetical protein